MGTALVSPGRIHRYCTLVLCKSVDLYINNPIIYNVNSTSIQLDD